MPSETTVKTHVTRVLAKLGVRVRVQAVVAAYAAWPYCGPATDRPGPTPPETKRRFRWRTSPRPGRSPRGVLNRARQGRPGGQRSPAWPATG
ncbi:LuxR C-terminal-related transcriptional regulator [Streptosporangium sp. NPDC087985]|uniref:LuxR C-terminal-related transcriptional regulator n=1 Tax=Streptosporangium sp. NPDC087985 TaxID=3366196 RepID=UPI00381FE811